MNPTIRNQSTFDASVRLFNAYFKALRTTIHRYGLVGTERVPNDPVPVGLSKPDDNSESSDVFPAPDWQKQQMGVADAEDR
ncbi:hypothetical protein, partial [Halobiforma nitratireducens]|uniref:hypothetical protein n=1 Tax=Halobiforma nitratireducens TaxID=130048 RepID=UPI0019552CF3